MSGSFDGKTTNGWASPQKKMTGIKALYEFFHAANIDTPTYKIIETGCDRCAEIAHQILREEFEKLDPGQ